ncbi:hypothetical protein CHARACLAT_022941 [Characodon lateralis]|uniref:Uncharacterized protein n=1 Tax=Characodon lateralis TaxID=208331 RepID=A0ABU7ECR9_9TELE|nr:hypothetical protein [Characodon lateralis]
MVFLLSCDASSIRARVQEQKPRQSTLQLLQDLKVFPSQNRCVVSLMCSGSASGSPPSGTCLKRPPPNPVQINVEKQQLYPELLSSHDIFHQSGSLRLLSRGQSWHYDGSLSHFSSNIP